jgi:hypothetical protein
MIKSSEVFLTREDIEFHLNKDTIELNNGLDDLEKNEFRNTQNNVM